MSEDEHEHEQKGCRVKGCPWRGPPGECPFPHYDQEMGDTFIDQLMRRRPGR